MVWPEQDVAFKQAKKSILALIIISTAVNNYLDSMRTISAGLYKAVWVCINTLVLLLTPFTPWFILWVERQTLTKDEDSVLSSSLEI